MNEHPEANASPCGCDGKFWCPEEQRLYNARMARQAQRLATQSWHTLPRKRRKELTTEELALARARTHAQWFLGIWEAEARATFLEADREAFKSQFVAAFVASWREQR